MQMTFTSWAGARGAMKRLIPGAEVTWNPDLVGQAAESVGIPFTWKPIDNPISLSKEEILRRLLAEVPIALSGDLILVTHDSFLGRQPYEVRARDLQEFVEASPPDVFDGEFFLIAPQCHLVIAFQSETQYAIFAVILTKTESSAEST